MPRLLPVTFALGLLLPAQGALAQAARPAAPAEPTERLLLVPPAGWSTGGSSTSRTSVTNHLFPPGQTSESWTEMLSIQIFAQPAPTPRAFAESLIETSRKSCESATPGPIAEGMLNGYPVATLSVACPKGRQSGKGGLIAMKAIQGTGALFVVERLWRGEPYAGNRAPVPNAVLQDWAAFLRAVGVCDTADPGRHPCPN